MLCGGYVAAALLLAPAASAVHASAPQSLRRAQAADPCQTRFPSGQITDSKFLGGSRRVFDRQASLYQVCEGFGAPESLKVKLTTAQKCALIAAFAVWGGPSVDAADVSHVCGAVGVISAYRSGGWLGAAKSFACGFFSDIFASKTAIFIAGQATETGAGAVGATAYRALVSALKLACGGLLTTVPSEFGYKLEARHETAVALDITRKGKCLEQTHKAVIGIQWWAVTCPASATAAAGPGRTGTQLHACGRSVGQEANLVHATAGITCADAHRIDSQMHQIRCYADKGVQPCAPLGFKCARLRGGLLEGSKLWCTKGREIVVIAPPDASLSTEGALAVYIPDAQGIMIARPASLVLGANEPVKLLTWTSWGDSVAFAAGEMLVNDCNPTCASGHSSWKRVRLELLDVGDCKGVRAYRRIVIPYTGTSKDWAFEISSACPVQPFQIHP